MLRLISGADQVTITDQVFAPAYVPGGITTAPDGNATPGVVNFAGTVGAWTLNITTGNTTGGTPTAPKLDLVSVNLSTSMAAPPALTLLFTETGFTAAPAGVTFFDSIGGTTQGSVSYQTYLSTANTPFAQTTLIDSPFISGSPAFSTGPGCCGPFVKFPATPYSLTQVVMINHPGGANTSSFTATLQGTPGVVPEPSTLLLLGSGLLVACRYARRNRG